MTLIHKFGGHCARGVMPNGGGGNSGLIGLCDPTVVNEVPPHVYRQFADSGRLIRSQFIIDCVRRKAIQDVRKYQIGEVEGDSIEQQPKPNTPNTNHDATNANTSGGTTPSRRYREPNHVNGTSSSSSVGPQAHSSSSASSSSSSSSQLGVYSHQTTIPLMHSAIDTTTNPAARSSANLSTHVQPSYSGHHTPTSSPHRPSAVSNVSPTRRVIQLVAPLSLPSPTRSSSIATTKHTVTPSPSQLTQPTKPSANIAPRISEDDELPSTPAAPSATATPSSPSSGSAPLSSSKKFRALSSRHSHSPHFRQSVSNMEQSGEGEDLSQPGAAMTVAATTATAVPSTSSLSLPSPSSSTAAVPVISSSSPSSTPPPSYDSMPSLEPPTQPSPTTPSTSPSRRVASTQRRSVPNNDDQSVRIVQGLLSEKKRRRSAEPPHRQADANVGGESLAAPSSSSKCRTQTQPIVREVIPVDGTSTPMECDGNQSEHENGIEANRASTDPHPSSASHETASREDRITAAIESLEASGFSRPVVSSKYIRRRRKSESCLRQ